MKKPYLPVNSSILIQAKGEIPNSDYLNGLCKKIVVTKHNSDEKLVTITNNEVIVSDSVDVECIVDSKYQDKDSSVKLDLPYSIIFCEDD